MARLKSVSWMEKALSTVSYSNIHVKYHRRTKNFDSGEWLTVEWWDGSDWNLLEQYRSGTVSPADFACGSGADNNANFKVRWSASSDKNNEFANVDNVEITGVAN